jgi:hypothetical protein
MSNTYPLGEWAATPFDPITEFQSKQAAREFQTNLENLCVAARLAFTILGKTRPELIRCCDGMGDGAADAAELLRDGVEKAGTLLELMESAERRHLVAMANQK